MSFPEKDMPSFSTLPLLNQRPLLKPFPDNYNPINVEADWYDWWESQGLFMPQVGDKEPNHNGVYVVPLPPPTVNGELHLGHALTVSVEDALCRWNRMLGKTTLFAPGFDHGGISTEAVVEKRLYTNTGQTRRTLGRDALLGAVQNWTKDHLSRITYQLRCLGGSYDWSRVTFTLDKKHSRAVVEAFCRLHEDGIIHRTNQLVNWCVALNTTLSEVEVETKQLSGRTMLTVPGYLPTERFEFGVISSFAYQVENSGDRIMVGTADLETVLGDTAIAVHPDDLRYQHLHGKFVTHPLVDRRIPIITDDTVNMELGSGAVKIAPAHGSYDYEVGLRHNLKFINILNDDGYVTEAAGDKFKGMKRFHARVAVMQALKDAGLYIGSQDQPMKLSTCRKSGDIVQVVLKSQWWIKIKPLAETTIKRARAGEVTVEPANVEADLYGWLENMSDWCVSRSTYWGHPCPAYFVRIEGQVQDVNDGKYWVVGRTVEEATERAIILADGAAFTLEQDRDILDTWFSSALWPFSILGWPEDTADFRHLYPLSLLETGCDTLHAWVAPMMVLGIYLTGKMPFKEVFCHAMVRDTYGRKMGKSLGNGVDPLDVIQGTTLEALYEKLCKGDWDKGMIAKAKAGQEKDYPGGIPRCGTDALRFALCAYSGGVEDIHVGIQRVKGYHKFCCKIYSATRWALGNFWESFTPESTVKLSGNEFPTERWILHKLNSAADETNKQLAVRNFEGATTAVYNFWNELCDVYMERMRFMAHNTWAASRYNSMEQTLYTCLDHGLRLLHPFMPFLTEELWQRLPRRPNDTTISIMVASFPVYDATLMFEEVQKDTTDVGFPTIRITGSSSGTNGHVLVRSDAQHATGRPNGSGRGF